MEASNSKSLFGMLAQFRTGAGPRQWGGRLALRSGLEPGAAIFAANPSSELVVSSDFLA
jgi:hypothetical protein